MGPSSPVLVLNQNYEPLNVCNVRRAFTLVDRGKAEIIENGRGYLHSPTLLFEIPSVIRLVYLIRRPRPQGRLTRRDVEVDRVYGCERPEALGQAAGMDERLTGSLGFGHGGMVSVSRTMDG